MMKVKSYALICALLVAVFAGCGKNDPVDVSDIGKEVLVQSDEKTDSDVPEATTTVEEIAEPDTLTDELAMDAVVNYCLLDNPDLENIIEEDQYPTYWEIESTDDNEIVVLFRSYTGALKRFYIDRNSGDTYTTEFVPGITDEEMPTEEQFNVKDYIK